MQSSRPSSRTTFRNKRAGHLLRSWRARPPGDRRRPEVLAFGAVADSPATLEPPVRIFIGTEPSQFRAESVLIWSILQVRDPGRAYEIHLMRNLEGYDRRGWKTGFTRYRYAIPAMTGGVGRAIYNDADQIYLADPAELYDLEMGETGMLARTQRETSVMLIDCEKMLAIWHERDAKNGAKHKHFQRKLHDADLWGQLPREWNTFDNEYESDRSKLLHFTKLQTQPWHPFPDQLKYEPHRHEDVWYGLERTAEDAGFTVFSEAKPSERYLEWQRARPATPDENSPDAGRVSNAIEGGEWLKPHADAIARLINQTAATRILEYGVRRRIFRHDRPGNGPGERLGIGSALDHSDLLWYDHWQSDGPSSAADTYDGVLCFDLLARIPEEDVPWILDKLFRSASRFVYVVADLLPRGKNAHCNRQGPIWWHEQMQCAARRNSGTAWGLQVTQIGLLRNSMTQFAS